MTPDKIKIGLIAITVLVTIALLVTLFKGHKSDYPYKELIAQKDSTIAAIKHDRETVEAELIERQISLDALETLDSVTYAHYREFQKVYKILDEKLQVIPNVIKRIANNNDSIRAEYSKFQ